MLNAFQKTRTKTRVQMLNIRYEEIVYATHYKSFIFLKRK